MKLKNIFIIGLIFITLTIIPNAFAADIVVSDCNDFNSDNYVNNYDIDYLGEDIQNLSYSSVESSGDDSIYSVGIDSEKSNLSLENDLVESKGVAVDNSVNNNFDKYSSIEVPNIKLNDTNTVYVNKSYTGKISNGTKAKPFNSIEQGIQNLLYGGDWKKTNLFIANGEYTLSNKIYIEDIKRKINIVGESASKTIIDCNGKVVSFSISNVSAVNFIDLTICNAYAVDSEIINCEDTDVLFSNVIFRNNKFKNSSSIFYLDTGKLSLLNVSVYNNIFDSTLSGCIIYVEAGNLNIINSSFFNNIINSYSNSTYGSLIFASTSDYNVLNVVGSSFYNNTISKGILKGPILLSKGYLFVNLINNTIVDNLINGSSSSDLVLIYDGFCYCENLTIENNTIVDLISYADLDVRVESLITNDGFNLTDIIFSDSFDLRNVNGTNVSWVTPIKSQGNYPTCWSFSAYAALESYLLRFENTTYDFSEANMVKTMSNLNKNNGTLDTIYDGADYATVFAYLLRGSGPVNESDDPYSNMINKNVLSNLTIQKYVQGISYVPFRYNFTDNNQIKYAIMNYGPVVTSIYMESNSSVNIYNSNHIGCNHAITIIGWDDNYSASNFNCSGVVPPGDGAFIIKDSWVNSSGGYFYVSYYDVNLGRSNCYFGYVFTEVENTSSYNTIYQYDIYGNPNISAGYLNETAWFANQFNIIDNSPIASFGIYTYGSSKYDATVYINNTEVYSQFGDIIGGGYHTIKFNDLIKVSEGDIIKITIKLTTPNCLHPIAIEGSCEGSINASAAPNQSFVSNNGINWTDLYTIHSDYNVCIKLYSKACDLSLDLSNLTYYNDSNLVPISFNLTNHLDYSSVNLTYILDEGVEIKEFNCSEGSFNSETKTWTLDSLAPGKTINFSMYVMVNSDKPISNLNIIVGSGLNNINKTNYTIELVKSKNFIFINSSDMVVIHAVNDTFVVNLTNALGEKVKGINVSFDVYDSDGDYVDSYYNLSDEFGCVKVVINALGEQSVVIKVLNQTFRSFQVNNTLIIKSNAMLVYKNISTYYNSGNYFKLTLADEATHNVLMYSKLKVLIYTGNNYKTVYVTTNKYGVAQINVNGLSVGSHNIYISSENPYVILPKTKANIKITTIPTKVSAPSISSKFKSKKYLKIKVKNSKTGKVVGSLKLKLKVYTGKKYKTVYVKTKSTGIAYYNVKSLTRGTHKVIISSANSHYSVKSTSYVKIN